MKVFLELVTFCVILHVIGAVNLKCQFRDLKLIHKSNTHLRYREQKSAYFTCQLSNVQFMGTGNGLSFDLSGTTKKASDVQCVFVQSGIANLIPYQIFSTFQNLDYFAIENNLGLKTIEANYFHSARKLRKLTIWQNHLKIISSSSFSTLVNLEFLCLAFDHIEDIDETAFQGLSKLKGLYLYANNLKSLKSQTLSPLVNLEELYLDRNQLSNLPNGFFDKNLKLKILTLSNNSFFALSPNFLQNQLALTSLDFENNTCGNVNITLEAGNHSNLTKELRNCFDNYLKMQMEVTTVQVGIMSEVKNLEILLTTQETTVESESPEIPGRSTNRDLETTTNFPITDVSKILEDAPSKAPENFRSMTEEILDAVPTKREPSFAHSSDEKFLTLFYEATAISSILIVFSTIRAIIKSRSKKSQKKQKQEVLDLKEVIVKEPTPIILNYEREPSCSANTTKSTDSLESDV